METFEGLFGGLLNGCGMAAMTEEQQRMYQQRMYQQATQQPFPLPFPYQNPFAQQLSGVTCERLRPRKKVESREITPTEIAQKQITGAVEAVKNAQDNAK